MLLVIPRFTLAKQLKNGKIAFYWNAPAYWRTEAEKRGIEWPFRAEALGTNYSAAMTRARELNRLLDRWHEGNGRRIRRGLVYFIRQGDFVKIGFTRHLAIRLASLNNGSPLPHEVVHIEQATNRAEVTYRRAFKHLQHRNEWFRFEGTLRTFLEALTPGQQEQTRTIVQNALPKARRIAIQNEIERGSGDLHIPLM